MVSLEIDEEVIDEEYEKIKFVWIVWICFNILMFIP